MKIEKIKISDLIEYENNAKLHPQEQIEKIKKSILEFGNNDPIAIDENNVLIEGHGRLKALTQLGKEEEEEKEFHRETTINQYNLDLFDQTKTEGRFEMPVLDPVDHVPKKLQGFNYVLNKPDYEASVHFFLDDYQFERIWQRPEYYIEKLGEFDCVLTPDFSLYIDMPVAMQVWNIYRSRLIGQIMQRYGYTVIPTVSWAYSDSFSFCFDGLPEGATLAISTIGIKQNKEQLKIWLDGVDAMIELLKPKRLLVYGGAVEYDYGDIEVYYFENETTERLKHG